MGVETWLVYVGAILVLMSTPGPSQLLMLSNSISHGFRKSIYTAAGDLTVNFIQMIVASVGLVGIITGSQEFFIAVKWAGVGYLVYLGLRLIFSKSNTKIDGHKQEKSNRTLYRQGFVTSAANPKAVIFFAALFPQFVDPNQALLEQFVILSSTYLLIDATFLCLYGKSADWISKKLIPAAHQYLNKISGSFLIGAEILLGLKDIESR